MYARQQVSTLAIMVKRKWKTNKQTNKQTNNETNQTKTKNTQTNKRYKAKQEKNEEENNLKSRLLFLFLNTVKSVSAIEILLKDHAQKVFVCFISIYFLSIILVYRGYTGDRL